MKPHLPFVFIFLMVLVFSSCTITKRKHLPGYSISFHKKYGSSRSRTNDTQAQLNLVDFDEIAEKQKVVNPEVPMDEIESEGLTLENISIEKGTNGLLDTMAEEVRLVSNIKVPQVQINQVSDQQTEKKKIKKGWRIFWLSLLGIILISAFLYVGARWPIAYVVWFGLTVGIIIVAIFMSLGDGEFWTRIGVMVLFIGLTLFYFWLNEMMFAIMTAIFWELALLGSLAMIVLLIYWTTKAAQKKE